MDNHPCLSAKAHGKWGRLHLPVAPECNIQCNYCVRRFDCVNESRPGVTSVVLGPLEAIERVRAAIGRGGRISVVGIAGPGDPLANEASFETLRLVRREFPEIILCMSTNGFLLPERLDDIVECGVKSLTVTINAVTAGTARKIYASVSLKGKTLRGGAEVLLQNQWDGLSRAVLAGLAVKVNTILMPGINDGEIPEIAMRAGREGAHTMNVMPLIPQAAFKDVQRPSCGALSKIRLICGAFISMMTHCKQCRADAFGLLGQDGDIEMETLLARIGQDYCDNV